MNARHTQLIGYRRRAQQGFTLVELSIAVLIGLFLLGGLLTLVQDMRRTFGSQNSLGQLQDNERLAMTLITDVIQAAGYYPDPTLNTGDTTFPIAAPLVPAPGFTQTGQSIAGTHTAAAPGDTVSVQFNTAINDGIINCRGTSNTAVAPTHVYVNTFRVAAANGGQLLCQLDNLAAVPLVTGVTNLQILYGIRKSGASGVNNVDGYYTATQLNATPADWLKVISVKVTLTFTNPMAATPGQPATIPFTRVVTVMNRAGVNTT